MNPRSLLASLLATRDDQQKMYCASGNVTRPARRNRPNREDVRNPSRYPQKTRQKPETT